MTLRTALMAATILALPMVAEAQPITGLYVGAGAGYNWMQPEKTNALTTPVTRGEGWLNSNGGAVALGSIGYGLGNGFRVEIEGDYRNHDFNSLNGIIPGPSGMSASGSEQDFAVMANALYDIDLRSSLGISFLVPYVGIGVGYDRTSLDSVHFSGGGQNFAFSGSTGSFAVQGILGASFPVPVVPGLAFTAEYRYFALPDSRVFSGTATFAPGAVSPGSPAMTEPASARLQSAVTHSLLLGVRYAFNVAPPPAPPAPMPVAAPAPALSRTYLVFFDWDRADLTDRARQIIKEAADASTRVNYTQIKVDGYTDLSGSAAYNQRLSVRRAESVAAELVRDGVPRTAIGVQGFGESNPLVTTAQGVREPQNRRVEIVFH